MDPLRVARGEEHVRGPALERAREHRSLRSSGVEDHPKVSHARLEVRQRNVPARQTRPSSIVEYQPRERRQPRQPDRVGGLLPCQVRVADEIELPDKIHRTFAGDLIGDVDAFRCPLVAGLGDHAR
jgi:hypothetical protein